MIKFLSVAVAASLLLAAPAFADPTAGGVASDVGAVQKDNVAIGSANGSLAADRAAKAHDKKTGNWGGQAVDSMKVGGDKMKRSEKKSEKDTDKQVLDNDVDGATGK